LSTPSGLAGRPPLLRIVGGSCLPFSRGLKKCLSFRQTCTYPSRMLSKTLFLRLSLGLGARTARYGMLCLAKESTNDSLARCLLSGLNCNRLMERAATKVRTKGSRFRCSLSSFLVCVFRCECGFVKKALRSGHKRLLSLCGLACAYGWNLLSYVDRFRSQRAFWEDVLLILLRFAASNFNSVQQTHRT
jgi:hypothetical protein